MFSRIKRRALHFVHAGIARFWVQPLEDRMIPALEKKSGWTAKHLLRWASWWANAGRVIVNEVRLVKKRWVGLHWSVTYIGTGERAEYLCNILFPTPPEEVEASLIFLWQVPGSVHMYAGRGDLVICELNQIVRLSPQGFNVFFTTPQSIQQVIDDFDRPMEEIMAGFQPHTRQRIRQLEEKGFSFELTHSKADFDLFFHRMYLPYTRGRHMGHSMILYDYESINSLFSKGVLILVKKDGETIAGGLRFLIGDTCTAYIMGVLDGRQDLVKQGSNVALAWFGMHWAHEQGARRYSLGLSFPLTSNGPFNFKRQWGARVDRDTINPSNWSFIGKDLSSPLREHLDKLGLITEIGGKHYQVRLYDPAKTGSETNIADELRHISNCGLAGIAVISPHGGEQLLLAESLKQDAAEQPYLTVHRFPTT
jgi:hypothetical protein